MIKTRNMAEAVRPKPRARKVQSKKTKPAPPAPVSEKVTFAKSEEVDVGAVNIQVEQKLQENVEREFLPTEKLSEAEKEKEENSTDSEYQDARGSITPDAFTSATTDRLSFSSDLVETKVEQRSAKEVDNNTDSSQTHAQAQVKKEDAEIHITNTFSEEQQSNIKRPQTLPNFSTLAESLKSVQIEAPVQQIQDAGEKKEENVQPVIFPVSMSLASHMKQHHTSGTEQQQAHRETLSSRENLRPSVDGPAVVEDPNTPMSRTTSPQAIKNVKEELKTPSPTVPVVLEEKSPTLMAHEALARQQVMDINATSSKIFFNEGSPSPLAQSSQKDNSLAGIGTSARSKTTVMAQSSLAKEQFVTAQKESKEKVKTDTDVKALSVYPSLQVEKTPEKTKAKIGPMSLSQLMALYYNPQLAHNDMFVDDFIQKENKKENHEFKEILSNYFRARHQLCSVEEDIRSLQKTYADLQKELWLTHVKSVVAQGQCADQARVTTTHQFEQCELSPDAVSQMETVLENIRKQIAENLSLYSYSAHISKLQVDSYIHDLYASCPALRDIPKNASIQVRHHVLPDESHQIQRLKDCITILFMFHRKPTNDAEFIKNIRLWTIRLVSTLLRVATFSDHLYILNHLLRCPAGVGKWAVELVQCPPLIPNCSQHQNNFGNPPLDHIITAMATVLLPAKARDEFMCHMRINLSEQSIQEDKAWILVDSDGEEDEDPANAWLYLHENDIVAFLGQFPLTDVFSHILLATTSESGSVDYDVRRSTEPMMIRLFAFSTVLIQLLGEGLSTYSMARYRQLNKRLGRLIRQTVSFVSDHWLNFKTYYGPLAPPASIESLQMEFDHLFMRATYSILTAQKLGSWQFMADMPYTCVSMDSMWQLLWILHQGPGQVVSIDHLPPVERCKEYLENPDSWQQLADNLMRMPTSEAIYLLTTFANMAGCRSFEEEAFIRTITLEVFEISYISNHTREFCSKVGRELLSSIIQTHPNALSFLLARVKEVMSKLGKMAIYLFSDLPLSIWQPTDPDMLILRQWLLNFELTSFENQLARVTLAKINWDVFEQTGKLVVDIRLHRQMALLLVESYTKFISDKKAGFFIMEGMRQMTQYMSSSLNAEQTFNNWAWDLALRLKLHQQSVLLHSAGTVDFDFQAPTLATDAWLLPLLKGTTNKTPIACFVSLMMTNIGHDITFFISEGLDLLAVLTTHYQYTTAIHVLGCIVPLFVDCQQYLLENVTFCQILQSLLAADESLFKSTKSAIMTVEFPGLVTQQLTEMIQAQITSHLTQGKADLMIAFWMKAIFKVCKYFTDKNSCYVADTIIRWSFVKKRVIDVISDIFKENYTEFCIAARYRQGLVTSVFQWIASSNTLPSYMDSSSLPEFPWLAYMILFVEGEMEVTTRLWQTLIMELHSSGRSSVDNALRTAIAKLQLEQAPSAGRLNIYRWAQQALDTPHDHPLLPILWQRFFALYLGRQVFESSIAQRASVGEKFFESMYYSNMQKRMRKRLSETASFHMNFDPQEKATAKRRRSSHSPGTPPGGDPVADFEAAAAGAAAEMEENLEYTSSKEFHMMMARLFQTYSLWLEEPRLHDGNLYLPALPPQYEASRLNQVFQGFMGPWLEFIDLEGIQYNLSCLAADWKKHLTSVKTAAAAAQLARRNTMKEPENATDRIARRLRRYDPPKTPPPIQSNQSAIPLISSTLIDDKEALTHLVSADLETLIHYTKDFSTRLAHHCALDNSYIELIPSLYSNVTKTITLTAECKSKVNPLHRCTNAAVIPVKIEVKERDEITQRRIDENRVEYKQVMIESLLPTAPNICIAAVHTENAITMLIKQSQQSTNTARVKRMSDIACDLFFHMAELICDEILFYPPAKQFFASCIEILGQEFVSRDPNQTQRVLQLCLDKPSVSGLVSPHYVPNSCLSSLVSMYEQLLHVLQTQNMDLVFMLLTKFDIKEWLEKQCPSEAERKRFVEILGSAMMACGAEPTSDSKLVFGLYLSNLASVLANNFPLNLYMVVGMILQGSATERLHTEVWETLLKSCFAERALLFSSNASKTKGHALFDPEEVKACLDCKLSTVQVKELLDWFSSFFMYQRMSDEKVMNFGLYATWSRYIQYISLMIGALARSFVTKVVSGSDETSPHQIIELLWQPLVGVFAPWIQPLVQSDGSMVAPWTESDDTLAYHMVSTFNQIVFYIYQQMNNQHPSSASGVLALLLMYYMTGLCTKTTPAHVIQIYVSEMKDLPWEELRPDVQLLETMTKVKEVSSPCCFLLIGRILPRIHWHQVIGYFKAQHHPEVTSRIQAGLAILLIQSYVDPEYSQDEETCRLLSEAQKFDWTVVTQEGFSCICSWFLQLCNPKCVLAERSSKLALGPRLLKQMSSFQPDAEWNENVSFKRLTYIHCITQQLCQVTYASDAPREDAVSTVIVNLLSEIEVVESSVPSVDKQKEESTGLLKDVLSLLNNSNPEGPWLEMIMTSITGWLKSSPQTLLLVPCMTAASTCLASLRQMSAVMEACFEVYFNGMDPNSEGLKGWSFLLSVFQVPELNQAGYVQDSLSENAFLVLYAYFQHKLPFCQGLSDEFKIMEEILDITTRSQPSAEDEAKLILWWHLLLRLVVRQVQFSVPSLTGTINIISRFNSHLNQIAQERTGRGLLGAIGLGQKSVLTQRMRLLARALSAFLTSQVLSTETLRSHPASRLSSNTTVGDLKFLRKNKSYSHLTRTIDDALVFVQDGKNTIQQVLVFLNQITKSLYGDKKFLTDVVSQTQV